MSGHSPRTVRNFRHDLARMLARCELDGLEVTRTSRRFATASTAEGDYVRVPYDLGLDNRGKDWSPSSRPNASLRLLMETVNDIPDAVSTAVIAAVAEVSPGPGPA